MMLNFYHAYKPTHRYGQTNRGWPWKADDPIMMFTRAEIGRLMATVGVDAGAGANFVSKFDCISDCCLASRRNHAEDLYEEVLSNMNGELDTRTHAAMLAMVGAYGVSYTDSVTGARGTPGQCREWTQAALHSLSIEEWLSMDLEQTVGKQFTGWALNGIKELAQRVHYAGSFEWLRLAPIMQSAKSYPQFSTKGSWTAKKSEQNMEAFKQASHNLLESILDALNRGASIKRALEVDAAAAGEDSKKFQIPDPPALQVGRMWMEALVQHAPNAGCLLALFEHPLLEEQAPNLIAAVSNKMRSFRWEGKNDLSKLRALVLRVTQFKSPRLAAALLRNVSKSVDQDQMLDMVQLCTEGHVMLDPRADVGTAGEDSGETNKEKPELTDLDNASREWVRRIHGSEPERKKIKKSQPFMYMGPDVWEAVPLSEEEMILERTQALAEAVPSCEKLLALPVFSRNQHGIIHELSQCFFLKGNPTLVLHALCGYAPSSTGFNCTREISTMLTRRGATAVRDAISATSTPDNEFRHLSSLITRSLPRASPLSHTLLFALIQAAHPDLTRDNFGAVSLEAVLAYTPLWLVAFDWVMSGKQYHTNSGLTLCCNAIRQLIESSVVALCSGEISLRTAHTVLQDGGRKITQFASCFKSQAGLNQEVLEQSQTMLNDFDSKLQALNCYLSVYCNAGDVEIDIEQMQGLAHQLTSNYDTLGLAAVQDVFQGVRCMQFMDWLYQLRGSLLFLELWRRHLHRAVTPDNQGQAQMDAEEAARLQELRQAIEQAQANGDEAQVQALGQVMMDLMQQRMAQQEQAEQDQAQVVLGQDAMEAVVIPAVQAEWVNLMTIVKDMTIPIPTVANLFDNLSKTELHRELGILAATGNPAQSEEGSSWHTAAERAFDGYLHLSQLRVWFPGVMRAATALQRLLGISADCDPLWTSLHDHTVTLQREWNSARLSTVESLSRATVGVFPVDLSPLHLDYLSALGHHPDLTEWLLDKDSNEEFQKLLQVCRQNNDEARVVSAIASLVRVRTVMLNTFYDIKYANLKELVNHVSGLDLAAGEEGDQSVLWHFNNAAANYDALVEMFSKQTHSPGIKACYDLAGIKQNGTFVICTSPTDSEVLTLEITNPSNDQVRREPLEFMLDIRNHVLLTEIPVEIEDELQISQLTEAFVPQLRSLCEIKSAVCSLYDSGHIDYQLGYKHKFSFLIDGLAALETFHQALVEQLSRFRIVVRAARANYCLLNYFTMREILHLHTLTTRIGVEANLELKSSLVHEFTSLMYLVSSNVEDSWVQRALDLAAAIELSAAGAGDNKMQALLETVGGLLQSVFENVPFITRQVPLPGIDSANRSDLLVTVGDDQHPIFVACCNDPIDSILSVYIRRGRLPEPSEVLFCTYDLEHEASVVEDITLLLWRFFLARKCGRQDCIFSVCDIQLLTYAQQCTVLENLNSILEEFGTADCASALLFVSTQPRQLILNALSAGTVDLFPLEVDELHRACSWACEQHLGTTIVVTSELEGGGKTHFIKKWVAGQQAAGNFVLYRKIPFREDSTADTLLSSLKNLSGDMPNAFHLDLGHLVPTNTNSVLFNLLLVGSLRDWLTVKVYPRRKQDVFLIEVANSLGNKTGDSLRMCSVLPKHRLSMSAEELDMCRPAFTNEDCTAIACPRFDELIWTAKFIQAFENNKFQPGEHYDPEYHPVFDNTDMTPAECYAIFEKHCQKMYRASFLTFSSFTKFMHHSIRRLNDCLLYTSPSPRDS
eukprot:TRINITY_DN17821_c0_g3_i2.p1 TRINITY_DN17821_c0_g3~~TRINITY_DN17821_c0_g3_i2.p1  ORF type:complete len:1745 (+),score=376.54 TRINITY_DN17821_c0_g3_i2:323-5557(+)